MASRRSILKKVRNGHVEAPAWMSSEMVSSGEGRRAAAEAAAAWRQEVEEARLEEQRQALLAAEEALLAAEAQAKAEAEAKAAAEAKAKAAAEAKASAAESKPKRRRSRRSEVSSEE